MEVVTKYLDTHFRGQYIWVDGGINDIEDDYLTRIWIGNLLHVDVVTLGLF
jgi:hypothetical protein